MMIKSDVGGVSKRAFSLGEAEFLIHTVIASITPAGCLRPTILSFGF